jgi:BirA family biotin operon repressor/biotin-[acetyl-CoA-carboxylase] ligase
MNSDFNTRLVSFLSVSESRSGEAIAAELGCSRTAVWKHIESLRGFGIGVDAVAGQGYRLREPLELLDEEHIRSRLTAHAKSLLAGLALLQEVDSTNRWLQALPSGEQAGFCVLAECQTAGRGRRGQHWISPFGRNIYLSLGWSFESGAGDLGCLPLLLALSASQALDDEGLQGHGIKWPNDLLLDQRKFGGCLVEVQGDVSGPCQAILGAGINVHMPPSTNGVEAIDQPWTDVSSRVPGISRNRLAASLVNTLLINLERYTVEGFGPFMAYWKTRDELAGKALELSLAGKTIRGTSGGISPGGGLLLKTAQGVGEYKAGEASIVRKGIQD